MSNTTRFDLPYLSEGQVNAEVSHNEGLDLVSSHLGLYIQDRDLSVPPVITEGEVYYVAAGATGDWDGQDGRLAIALNSAWSFSDLENGEIFFVADEGAGGVWLNALNFRQLAPRIALRKTIAQTISGIENVEWDAQLVIDGYFTHSITTLKDRINIPEDGLYEIEAQITVERTAGSGETSVVIKAYDGTSQIPGAEAYLRYDAQAGNKFATAHLHVIASLTSSYIKITCDQIGGATVQIAANGCFLKITRP